MPSWVKGLPEESKIRKSFDESVLSSVDEAEKIRDIEKIVDLLADNEFVREVYLESIDLGEGIAKISIGVLENLFYQTLEEISGFSIKNDFDLLSLIKDLSIAKKEYDRIADALADVREKGYGIVTPSLEDMVFDEPEIIKRGNQFGVKLKANAPSIHMIRADINAEVSPVVGTEKQSEELIAFLQKDFEDNPEDIWETEFLGRSLHDIMKEGISNKLYRMPESAQHKIKDTIEKIVNEGSGGLICIIL